MDVTTYIAIGIAALALLSLILWRPKAHDDVDEAIERYLHERKP